MLRRSFYRALRQSRRGPKRGAAAGLLVVLIVASPALGQEAVETPRPSVPSSGWTAVKEEVQRYASDSLALVKAPLDWDSKDLAVAAGAGLTLGGLMLADRRFDEEAQQQRSGFTDRVSGATTWLGGAGGMHIGEALLIGGLVLRNPEIRDTGREILEAAFISHVLVKYVVKPAFGRERPEESQGKTVFHPFSRQHGSFPSADATQAFAIASVVATRSKGWVVPTVAYAGATLVAMDRVNDRAHFVSDVAAGAVLGTVTGRFIVHRHRKKAGDRSATAQVIPIPEGLAVRLVF